MANNATKIQNKNGLVFEKPGNKNNKIRHGGGQKKNQKYVFEVLSASETVVFSFPGRGFFSVCNISR